MESQHQLTLFPIPNEKQNPIVKKQKKAKLGRYERLQRELSTLNPDPYQLSIDVNVPSKPKLQYNFVDLFCGAGGITQGFSQSSFNPVASVEIDPIASATHRKNFPNCSHFGGDIYEFDAKSWLSRINSPTIHLVVGGPPCQGFSVAGKRDPNDPRNHLFKEFIRVVSEIKPWYVVMENVPGILTMKQGKTKQEIIEAFENIGNYSG